MSPDATDDRDRFSSIAGVGSAVGQTLAFGAVGVLVFDSLAYGAVAGVMSGTGSYLFLPWFLRLSMAQDSELPFADAIERTAGRPRRSLFGLGLELGAIVMLATGLAFDAALLAGVAAGLTVAVTVYLVSSVALDRAGVGTT